MEMILELGYCNGSKKLLALSVWSPAWPGRAGPLVSTICEKRTLIYRTKSHVFVPQAAPCTKVDRSRKGNRIVGVRVPPAIRVDNRPMRFDEWELILRPKRFLFSGTPGPYEAEMPVRTVAGKEQVVRPTGLVDPLIESAPATSQVDDSAVLDRTAAA